MSKLGFVVLPVIFISFVACAPEAKRADGTVDSGGGNGFDRKVLESYRYDIAQSPESAGAMEALDNISVVSSNLASILYSTFVMKPWYLVPFDLNKLSPQTIGVQFNSDQMALHYIGEVWLSKLSWDKMSPADRTTLLVHEALMGARLYKFKSERERCWTKSFLVGETLDSSGFSKRKRNCEIYRWTELAREYKGQFLSTEEYQMIREMTSAISSKKGILSEVEFDKLTEFLVIKNTTQNENRITESTEVEVEVEPL